MVPAMRGLTAAMLGAKRSDPFFTKTILLLKFDNEVTGTTVTADKSPKRWLVTAQGAAKVTTASSKFGSGSGFGTSGGGGDKLYVTLNGDTSFAIGTDDFTVECWVNFDQVNLVQTFYDQRPASTNGVQLMIRKDSGATISLFVSGVARITSSTLVVVGPWYHIAVARSGTSTKLFMNGIQEGSTYSDSNSYLNDTAGSRPFLLCDCWDSINDGFIGRIDDVRVTRGVCRYPGNFVPPGPHPVL